jgi:hypothetical protein
VFWESDDTDYTGDDTPIRDDFDEIAIRVNERMRARIVRERRGAQWGPEHSREFTAKLLWFLAHQTPADRERVYEWMRTSTR